MRSPATTGERKRPAIGRGPEMRAAAAVVDLAHPLPIPINHHIGNRPKRPSARSPPLFADRPSCADGTRSDFHRPSAANRKGPTLRYRSRRRAGPSPDISTVQSRITPKNSGVRNCRRRGTCQSRPSWSCLRRLPVDGLRSNCHFQRRRQHDRGKIPNRRTEAH